MGVKYRVNETFFDKWTPEMSYVLGFIYADGSLENAYYLRGKYLRISSVERYSLERIKRWLNSEHKIVVRKPASSKQKPKLLLRIGSHKLYDALEKLGLCPNKSLTISFPKVPKKYLAHFVRGYFDGDGCVNLWRTKGKNNVLIVRKLSVIFTSGSKDFLAGLHTALKSNVCLKLEKIYDSRRSFQLRYGTADSIEIFKYMYKKASPGCYFERKKDIFKLYFSLRPSKINPSIKTVIAI